MIFGCSLCDVNVFPCSVLGRPRQCSYNLPPCEGPVPFTVHPYRRFPVYCPVTYQTGLFEGHGTIWNVSLAAKQKPWKLITGCGKKMPSFWMCSRELNVCVACRKASGVET